MKKRNKTYGGKPTKFMRERREDFRLLITILSVTVLTAMPITLGNRYLEQPESHQNAIINEVQAKTEETPKVEVIDMSEGVLREVTAYNAGDPNQTDSSPCISASGDDICKLLDQGIKVCAANFVPLRTKLYIDKIGECVVLDRMNKRFTNRVDIAMKKDEKKRAIKFGKQNLKVLIIK